MVKNEIVAIFGNGNLGVCAVHNKTENIGGILLKTLDKEYKIGETYEEDDKPYPIKLIFENVEGIDVLIRQLGIIREAMMKNITETEEKSDIESILNKLKITTSNYKSLIEDVSNLAQEIGLPDDATIDEIYCTIKDLKNKLRYNKELIKKKLEEKQNLFEQYVEDGDIARCKMQTLEEEIKDLEELWDNNANI